MLTSVHGSVKQKIVKNSGQTIGAFKGDISCLAPKGQQIALSSKIGYMCTLTNLC